MSNLDPEKRWLDGLLSHIYFQLRGSDRGRRDKNFDWLWFKKLPTAHFIDTRRRIRKLLNLFNKEKNKGYTTEWLKSNSAKLWETRQLLVDGLSRRQFDDAIVLKVVGYRRSFFPAEAFDIYLKINGTQQFSHLTLPDTYMGLSLHILNVEIGKKGEPSEIIAADGFTEGLNRYRQYFVERDGIRFAPQTGEIVLDCGACIGDVATVFAMHVGSTGQVHLFDPMPTHVAFCNEQKALNPHLASRMHVVPMAVGMLSNGSMQLNDNTTEIEPNAVPDSSFPFVSIDDYVRNKGIRVDVIKMDIEGGEGDALRGAEHTLRTFQPRLMISAYHRQDDLWALRELIQEINPNYRFHFGHHTPVQWESVFYAT
ncbi:FkbM family methyltransferase [Comamonas sp. J-3]|uniref:FkbM family methyltransferase n=1 Tax=Comamonas trifloxystrobinivorans TaxID=3350256 RepID=UPI00372821F4